MNFFTELKMLMNRNNQNFKNCSDKKKINPKKKEKNFF